MLYVTTRSNRDAYTANRALCENRAPDGGLYVPFKMPVFAPEDLIAMGDKSFGQRLADILNLLFGSRLTGWDVEFAVGRYPVRLSEVGHRALTAESWHNPQWDHGWMSARLIHLVSPNAAPEGDWPALAVRIAVLFAIFAEPDVSASTPMDVVVPSGDLSAAMAARYARDWGLPIGNIILCCNENAALWDLFQRGELRTGAIAAKTSTPDCDRILPRDLERLIHAAGGAGEVERFLEVCRRGGLYCPSGAVHSAMSTGLHVSVVGDLRVRSAIRNVYNTNSYLCGPYTALCHCGLMDYRAVTGESRPALILSERGPAGDPETVASAMGIPVRDLKNMLK